MIISPDTPILDALEASGLRYQHCLTHLSMNGQAKTELSVVAARHPFAQLKMAENTITEKASTLQGALLQYRSSRRDRRVKECELNIAQEELENLPDDLSGHERSLRIALLEQTIGDIGDQLVLGEIEDEKLIDMIRDCEKELQTARDLRNAIIEKNPRFAEASFDELQAAEGYDALVFKLSEVISKGLLVSHGIPEEVAQLLLELEPQQREKVFSQAAITAGEILPMFMPQLIKGLEEEAIGIKG